MTSPCSRTMQYTVWTPDVCCHSLLVSVVATFLFPLARRRVLVILRLPCPWLLDLPKLSLADLIFFLASNSGSHRVNFIYIQPVELHFLHAFTSNSPPDMSSSMCRFVGDKNHLIVIRDTAPATSAITAGLGFVSITALIIITVALYLTLKHRGQTRERRGSVTTPVIDICRLARSSVERQSCVAEPHRPPEAHISSKTTTSPNSSPLIEPTKSLAILLQYQGRLKTRRRVGADWVT
jgi:hypothetical protein